MMKNILNWGPYLVAYQMGLNKERIGTYGTL